MSASRFLLRQGHRLIQIGVALFLFSALEGFFVHAITVPRLGLSVHTLSGIEGVILIALGLVWPRLQLGIVAARIAFWFFVYSTFGTLLPYVLAAIWGAGNSIIPLAAGSARGTPLQETILSGILMTAAPPVLISLVLILWGLHLRLDGRDTTAQSNAASSIGIASARARDGE